jgi:hypothetical protein
MLSLSATGQRLAPPSSSLSKTLGVFSVAAKRCSDPQVAAELVSIAETLHTKAEELASSH